MAYGVIEKSAVAQVAAAPAAAAPAAGGEAKKEDTAKKAEDEKQSQEKAAAGSGSLVFVMALLFVFLILAAQYESWSLPMGVMLGTPIAIFGAMLMNWTFLMVAYSIMAGEEMTRQRFFRNKIMIGLENWAASQSIFRQLSLRFPRRFVVSCSDYHIP